MLNASYQQLAAHYGVAVVPARPYRPKDKAKAEVGVQIVERWIMARLRHQSFFTLAALNQAIGPLVADLNSRPFKRLPGSRRSQFEQLDQPALRPLPAQRYRYVQFKQARVHIDYHIEYERHYYSVPHHLVKQRVEVQAGAETVAIYVGGQRVASHPRSRRVGGHSTCAEHMPQAHRQMTEWTPQALQSWADGIGPGTGDVVRRLFAQKRHPEQSLRRVLALLSNTKRYGRERLNAACTRALLINSPTRSSIESILKQGLDQRPVATHEAAAQTELALELHENVRGEAYYH